jgi:hypothetical protein
VISEAVRHAAVYAVVRTFARMDLRSGRRNHFYILALGASVSGLLPIAHHSARLPLPVEIRPHVGAALEKMLAQ